MKKCLMIVMLCVLCINVVSVFAQEAEQLKPYEGEITAEMVTSFVKADLKIRLLRQQAAEMTRQVLASESIKPEVYLGIATKMQQNPELLEQVRAEAKVVIEAAKAAQVAKDEKA